MRAGWVVGAALLVALPVGGLAAVAGDRVGGRVDLAIERAASLVPGFPRREIAASIPAQDAIEREHRFTYGGVPYAWRIGVERDAVEAARAAPRSTDPRAYGAYVDADDPAVERVAEGLVAVADARRLDSRARANLVLAFVQGIEYARDGDRDWPQLPAETLADGRGDCEDMSILYASLAGALGIDAALLLLPGHMAVGARIPGELPRDAGGYVYGETTQPGYRLGEIPPPLRGLEIEVIPAAPVPALAVTLAPRATAHGWVVRVDVWNNGTAPASLVSLYAGAAGVDGRGVGNVAEVSLLAEGARASRWIWVPAPEDAPDTLRAVAWTDGATPVGADAPAPALTAPSR